MDPDPGSRRNSVSGTLVACWNHCYAPYMMSVSIVRHVRIRVENVRECRECMFSSSSETEREIVLCIENCLKIQLIAAGSHSMFSESIHSLADTINQVPVHTWIKAFLTCLGHMCTFFTLLWRTSVVLTNQVLAPGITDNSRKLYQKNRKNCIGNRKYIYFTFYSSFNDLQFTVLSVTVFIPYWDLGKHFEVLNQLVTFQSS